MDTPPLIVESLVKISPKSASVSVPGTQIYLLHITASELAYVSQSLTGFEIILKETQKDILVELSWRGGPPSIL
jgi:hypothetical protein